MKFTDFTRDYLRVRREERDQEERDTIASALELKPSGMTDSQAKTVAIGSIKARRKHIRARSVAERDHASEELRAETADK